MGNPFLILIYNGTNIRGTALSGGLEASVGKKFAMGVHREKSNSL